MLNRSVPKRALLPPLRPLYSLNLKDEDETDVDCGGSSCAPCADGFVCLVDSDCLYNNCPDQSYEGEEKICASPSRSCPNDCGGPARGVCQHVSSLSGIVLLPSQCLVDTPAAACRATCVCVNGFKGDACQYTEEELRVASKIRESSLQLMKDAQSMMDITGETLTRQATLLSAVRRSKAI